MAQILPLSEWSDMLSEWLPPSASLAFADDHEYVEYRMGRPGAIKLPIHFGTSIPGGSVAQGVLAKQSAVAFTVDKSVFGSVYYGKGYPIHVGDSAPGALAVVLPPSFAHTGTASTETVGFLMGQKDSIWRPLPVQSIAYIESYLKKTWLYVDGEAYISMIPLHQLERRLPNYFLRIHRAHLVNLDFIDHIARDEDARYEVTLKAPIGRVLPVGQTFVRYLRETLGF
ncbi:LytTR family transcriptional regulator [Alicyclobacillaceae bacterium I2511]|nr:LytTR family transcriptional regulator [Alicyclobacillaceae bacterium I2511]